MQSNSSRSDADILMNAPVRMKVGSGIQAKTVEIAEPTNMQFARHMESVSNGIADLINRNQAVMAAMFSGQPIESESFNVDFSGFHSGFEALVAELVGESPEWTREYMTPRQTVLVLSTYMDLLGYDLIKTIFFQAREKFIKATPIGQKPTEDSEPRMPRFAEPSQ